MSSSSSTFVSRLADASRSSTGKLVLVAAASTALTAGSIFAAQALRRTTRRKNLKSEIEHVLEDEDDDGHLTEELRDFTRPMGSRKGSMSGAAKTAATGGRKGKKTSEVIIREALARNYAFFGQDKMEQIRDKFVVVVGVGGVGSAAAVMLVRSGIRKIRIIDFDQVSLSSLNRHSTASLAEVGTPKVTSCAEYFASVAPWVEVDARIELFEKDKAAELLEGNPDYVIDCIDNIESKVDLLAYCAKNGIKVFSALGAGAKSDPSRIQVSDISTTFEDPLARQVRRRLRMEGVFHGVPVVYSTEKPRSDLGLLPLPEEEFQRGKVDELHAMSNFRVRILPVLGPLPAMFGNAAATYVLLELAGFKTETLPVKNRQKTAATMHRQLAAVENQLTGSTRIPFSEDDMLYLFEEIHRARSVAPPHVFPARPTVLRWRKEKGLAWDNLVVFERDEGARHEEHCLMGDEDPEEYWGPEVTALAVYPEIPAPLHAGPMPLQPSDVYGARLKVTLDRVKIEMSAVRGCLEGIMQARDETDALRHQLATLHELVNAQGDVLEKRVTGSVAAIVESQLVPLFEKLCASSYSLSASLKTAEANAIARARGQNARIEQVEISVQRKLEEFEAHVKLERSARTECRCGATLKSLEDRLKRGLREMDECKAQVAKLEQELRISKRHDLPFAPGAARSSTPGSPAGVQDSDQNVQQASIVTGRKEVSPGSPNTSALVPDNIAASPPSRRRSRLQTSEHTGHMAMSDEDLGTPARDYSATGKAIAAIARASSILAQYHTASSDSIMSTLTPLSSTATELGSSSHAVAAESVEHVPCTSTNYAGELTVQRRGVRKQSNHTAALFATHVREATLDQRKRLIEQDLSQGEKVGTGAHHTNEHQGAVVFFTDQDTEENEPDTEE